MVFDCNCDSRRFDLDDELLNQDKGGADILLSLFFDLDFRRANAPPEDVVNEDELEERDDDDTKCGEGISLMNSGRVSIA